METNDLDDGFFAHAPTVVDIDYGGAGAPRRRIRGKQPATPDELGAPPSKKRRPG